jgi:CDP-diacylglycerol--glycerol-3-phosphate 3-phosphatidyltransferase
LRYHEDQQRQAGQHQNAKDEYERHGSGCYHSIAAQRGYNSGRVPHRSYQLHAPQGLWPLSWPMGLTMLRMLLLPVFLWVLLVDAGRTTEPRPHRWWAVGIFTLMAITDKLDGYLARRLNQTSHLGSILDPVADKLLISCSSILLSFEWVASPGYRIPIWVVAAIYAKDVLVAVGVVALLALVGTVTIRPRPLGKVSTVLQLSLVVAAIIGPDFDQLYGGLGTGLLRFLCWSVALLAIAAAADYVGQGLRQLATSRTGRNEIRGSKKA